MKLRVVYIWSNRGHTVSISQKLVVMPRNIQSHFVMRDPVLQNVVCQKQTQSTKSNAHNQ